MSTPTFHGETMSPLFGHATEWTLTYDGRPVHVFMHNPHHETPQFVITAMDTHRKFRQTSKRGRGIVALIRDAYKQRFAGLHFDDADAEPEFGYICKHCHGPAPVGIGYVADGADAAARSEGLTACECGYSTTDAEEEPMSTNEKSPAPAATGNEGKSFAEERSTASYINALLDDKAFLKSYIAVLQSQLWQAQNVVGGAEPRVILAYFGTGTGTPKFLARTAQRWQDHPEHGWEIVAHIDADGTIRQGGEK